MKVLLIEDEAELAKSITHYLSANELICEYAPDATTALEKIVSFQYDCILLDLMLPDGSGFEVLRKLRKNGNSDGVIIISAKDGLESKIEGLTIGADDYLVKPFHLSELLARIVALVRRKNFKGNNLIQFNEINIDIQARNVAVNEKQLDLTKKEFELLLYLIANENKVLSKAAIAEHLSGDMADMLDNHDFVYAHAKNLKNKLKDADAGDYIKTVYGLGYKWQDD